VEAQALGGLIVLLRAAGLDVIVARERARVLGRIDERVLPSGPRWSSPHGRPNAF
jgi:hypothetical protein